MADVRNLLRRDPIPGLNVVLALYRASFHVEYRRKEHLDEIGDALHGYLDHIYAWLENIKRQYDGVSDTVRQVSCMLRLCTAQRAIDAKDDVVLYTMIRYISEKTGHWTTAADVAKNLLTLLRRSYGRYNTEAVDSLLSRNMRTELRVHRFAMRMEHESATPKQKRDTLEMFRLLSADSDVRMLGRADMSTYLAQHGSWIFRAMLDYEERGQVFSSSSSESSESSSSSSESSESISSSDDDSERDESPTMSLFVRDPFLVSLGPFLRAVLPRFAKVDYDALVSLGVPFAEREGVYDKRDTSIDVESVPNLISAYIQSWSDEHSVEDVERLIRAGCSVPKFANRRVLSTLFSAALPAAQRVDHNYHVLDRLWILLNEKNNHSEKGCAKSQRAGKDEEEPDRVKRRRT